MLKLPTDLGDHLRGGGTLVVPSRQRAYAVRLAEAAAQLALGRPVWTSADVLPLPAWLHREAQRSAVGEPGRAPRLLSAGEEWFLWRECTRELTRSLALLDAAALADSLRRSAELAADYGIVHGASAQDPEAGLLARVQNAFRARCEGLGAASAGAWLRAAPRAPERALLLRGFAAIPPRLRSLVPADALAAPAAPGTVPAVLRVSGRQEELGRIAEWCGEHVERQPDARLLVMLPGPPGARERLAAVIRQRLDPRGALGTSPVASALVGIEGGQPLGQLPMVAHALRMLEWAGGGELELETLCAWLEAPHWSQPAAGARARLAVRVRERGGLALSLRTFLGGLQDASPELRCAARELGAALIRAAAALGEASAPPRSWSERFRAALAAAGWPGPSAAGSAGRQTLVRWHELLEEFGSLSRSATSFTRPEELQLLRELAAHTPFRPADEDVTVTVSPALADPVVHYDGIWVAGLTADVLPEPVQPDPFLSLAAQRATGVPAASTAGRLAEAQMRLASWRAATGQLVLSVPAHVADLELIPSPLLAEFPAHCAGPPRPWLPNGVRREAETELLGDEAGEPWSTRQRLPRGTRCLDLQNLCPFRAYAELRLGAVPPEIVEPGVAATQRGVLLHAALRRVWTRLRDSRSLQALPEPALYELIGQCVAQASRETFLLPAGRRPLPPAEGQLELFGAPSREVARECRRAVRLIRTLCELERRREPFRVVEAEAQRELLLGGATLGMRIDRIDELADGGLAVLDYKSGLRTAADWYGDRPTHPQLLAYGQALGEAVAALATVSLTARRVRFEGIAREPRLLPQVSAVRTDSGRTGEAAWRERQQRWRVLLEGLIAGFLAGEARVDPKPGACDYCHLSDVCRIAEAGGGPPGAASLAAGPPEGAVMGDAGG